MTALPIIPHLAAQPPPRMQDVVERLAVAVRGERPELALPENFRSLAPNGRTDGPTLHLDDLSQIPRLNGGEDIRFYQDRARLRAGDGDVVASCGDPVAGHESYCRDYLGLGSPQWLRPRLPRVPLRIAEACWEDPTTRADLLERLRHDQLAYIHPHMGTRSVWELGLLLQAESHRPLQVIGPPPGLARWVNDKIAFAGIVSRLLGPASVPRTESACNFAAMTQRVKELSNQTQMLGFKLPTSAGGAGNLVVAADTFRGRSLDEIRKLLKYRLRELAWDGCSELLIDCWETDVLCSPSVQLWIPPVSLGPPIVEGIFLQTTEGVEGAFVGTAPAQLPADLTQEITDRSWLVALLFQQLGYVGRCSFDLILVGKEYGSCRLEFIECNGRWGGTSLYMTLMNRIFGDWADTPFAVHVAHHLSGLNTIDFTEILNWFQDELFDIRTKKGSLILSNPGQMKYQSGITVAIIASSWSEAAQQARQMPERLKQMIQGRNTRSSCR